MHAARLAVAVLVGAALALVAVPGPVSATISAPYTEFTMNGDPGEWLSQGHSAVFDPDNATITGGGTLTSFDLHVDEPLRDGWNLHLAPPPGGQLAVGTFATAQPAEPGKGTLTISGEGRGCSSWVGSVTVDEVSVDPADQTVVAFAASYTVSCDSQPAIRGTWRLNSTRTYAAPATSGDVLDFGTVVSGQTSIPLAYTVTSRGPAPVTLGPAVLSGFNAAAFTITSDGCTGRSLATDESCAVDVVVRPTAVGFLGAVLTIPTDSPAGALAGRLAATGGPRTTPPVGLKGTYYPADPYRLLDTRIGNGAPKGAVGPGGTVHLQVTGRGNIPATGVDAVVLNVTVTAPTVGGYVTVFPTGVARPTASSLNFVRGWTGANSVTVKVGTGGKVDLFNFAGRSHLIVDVLGFYSADDSTFALGIGGQFQPVLPTRLLDTRRQGGAIPAGRGVAIAVDFDFDDVEINSHVRALAVNITAVTPTRAGYLSAWNGAGPHPVSSTLNFTAGAIVPNMAVVPTIGCTFSTSCLGMPSIAVFNASPGATQVLIDVVGFFDDSTLDGGLRFRPVTPTRIVDSRRGQGIAGALGQARTATVTTGPIVAGTDGVGLSTNVTAVAPNQSTYLTVWPTGIARPTVSSLNPARGQTVANAVIAGFGTNRAFNVFNFAGSTQVVIDVNGVFYPGLTATGLSLRRPTLTPTKVRTHPRLAATAGIYSLP